MFVKLTDAITNKIIIVRKDLISIVSTDKHTVNGKTEDVTYIAFLNNLPVEYVKESISEVYRLIAD